MACEEEHVSAGATQHQSGCPVCKMAVECGFVHSGGGMWRRPEGYPGRDRGAFMFCPRWGFDVTGYMIDRGHWAVEVVDVGAD